MARTQLEALKKELLESSPEKINQTYRIPISTVERFEKIYDALVDANVKISKGELIDRLLKTGMDHYEGLN